MQKTVSGFILKVIKPFWGMLIIQLFVSIIYAIDLNIGPYIIKMMLDVSHKGGSEIANKISWLAIAYIGLYMTFSAIYRVYDYICLLFNSRLKKRIGVKLVNKLMKHSYNFYQNQFAGSLTNNTKNVMNSVPLVIEIIIERFFNGIITICISVFAFWHVSPIFSVALVVWGTVFIIFTYKFTPIARNLASNAASINSQVIGHIVDILGNMFSVRVFNGPNFEKNKLGKEFNKSVQADQKRDWFFLKMFSLQSVLVVSYQAICLYYLIILMRKNTITTGDFVLIITLNIQLINKFWGFTKYMNRFASEIGNIKQSLDVIYSPQEIKDEEVAKDLIVNKDNGGQIKFENVTFGHRESNNLFNNLSITIPAGQKVGLVGYSGSGKSTFVNLILRLYDPLSGKILIDGQNIAHVTQNSLRRAIGLIPQEAYLFHRSLLDNIKYGNFSSSDTEVYIASRKARADEFIQSLPEKYDTLVGEKGIKLSGGQRQRIAIARAILKNPPILVLDEATSHLDSLTEAGIQQSLSEIMKNKTALVVAHRLSTLLGMDRILVFNKGAIVEDGTHEELIKLGRLYASLWKKQQKGLLSTISAVPA